MTDKVQTTDIKSPAAEGAAPAPATPGPRRGPGHRGADVRDTVAEMTEKAQQLSLEAGSKVAGAMKDVIYAAAGITGFAIESARDLVQYMVRRGQMRSEEADRIMREVEEAHAKRKPGSPPPPPRAAEVPRPVAPPAPPPQYVPPKPRSSMPTTAPIPSRPPAKVAAPAKPAATKVTQAAKPAAKSAPAKGKSAAKAPPKAAAKGGAKKAAKKR